MQDFYEARNSIYCYDDTNVLINKLNIKDSKQLFMYETKITAAKLLILRKVGISGDFDKIHFVGIHRFLFEDIYPFAGLFRTENIAKDNFRFAEWRYIEEQLDNILNNLKKENYLEGLDKGKLAERLAYYMSEINVLHPFRERKRKNVKGIYKTACFKKWI